MNKETIIYLRKTGLTQVVKDWRESGKHYYIDKEGKLLRELDNSEVL